MNVVHVADVPAQRGVDDNHVVLCNADHRLRYAAVNLRQ